MVFFRSPGLLIRLSRPKYTNGVHVCVEEKVAKLEGTVDEGEHILAGPVMNRLGNVTSRKRA